MWSHYTNGHKGICLEFSTDYRPFGSAIKVKYQQDFPKGILSDAFIHRNPSAIEKSITTKFTNWEYEKEYRILLQANNQLIPYEAKALKSVYFGCSSKDQQIEIVCQILKIKYPNTKTFLSIKDINGFSIHFKEFDYNKYLEEKA